MDGRRVAFESSDHFVENLDLDTELFVIDIAAGQLSQLTRGTGNHSGMSARITADGRRVIYGDTRTLGEPNPDGRTQVFIATCAVAPEPPPACEVGPPGPAGRRDRKASRAPQDRKGRQDRQGCRDRQAH
jgi:hypothetical protein